jgi:hypothetical protein
MKKKNILIGLLMIILILITIAHFLLPILALDIITNYKPYTFEKVLSNPDMCIDFGINDCKTPNDYGFRFEEINYISLDETSLNGWYINALKPSAKCMLIIHGRTSNRLKTMKYLALVDSFDLDTAYNIFIPDLRNSGKSEKAKTLMGYKFGEDVTASLLMLHEKREQDTVMLYGFSMGAMAIANAIGRPDLKSKIEEKGIYIEKIILDSPLSNVKSTLRDQTSKVPFSGFYFDRIFNRYSNQINGFGENMRLSKLIPKKNPILILQSKDDQLTLSKNLESELQNMHDYSQLSVTFFEGPDHVRIFQDTTTKSKYLQAFNKFLNVK